MVVNAELLNRAETGAIAMCVNKHSIKYNTEMSGFIEVLNMIFKTAKDGRPYISFTFRDVNGEILHGSTFDADLTAMNLEDLRTLKNVYAEIKYKAIILGTNLHLQVSMITFCTQEDSALQLEGLFKTNFDKFEAYYTTLVQINFGIYESIAEKLIKTTDFKAALHTTYVADYGYSLKGYIVKSLYNIASILQLSDVDLPLARLAVIYALTFYARNMPRYSFRYTNYLGEFIENFISEKNRIYTCFGVHKGENPLLDKVLREIELCLNILVGIPTNHSKISITLAHVLDSYKKQVQLSASLNAVTSGTVLIDDKNVIID